MGGRPTVVGLLAVAVVAVFLASAVAVSRAAAEFRIPGLFESKPKAGPRKQVFRPTMPRRNPGRVTAGVSAAALSPEIADKSEAAVVAGAASSASVALALESPANREEQEESPSVEKDSEATALENDEPTVETAEERIETTGAANETGTAAQEEDPNEEPAGVETAQGDIDKPAEDAASESAETDTDAADVERPETAETPPANEDEPEAAETKDAESADGEAPVETADAASESAEDDPISSSAETDASEPARETAATDKAEDADGPEKVVEETKPEPVNAKAEQTVTAAIAAVTDPEDEIITVEGADSIEQVRPPAHNASVVLQVSPPPQAEVAVDEKPLDTAAAPEPTEEPAKEESKEEPEETQVAALTPPDAPAASDEPAPTSDDASEPAALDTASSDDETVVEEEIVEEEIVDETIETEDVSPATEPESQSTAGEGEVSNTDEPDAEASAATPGEEDAVAEEAGPPPAHPVVAAIRTKLEEPGQYKGAAGSDLDALKELYGARTDPPLWVGENGFSGNAEAVMAEIARADDWGLEASSFDLPSVGAAPLSEDAQADAEIALSIAILSYARDAQIGRLTPSRVSKLFDQHPSLRDPKTVLTEMAAAGSPDAYLLSLHPQHDQYKRLQRALVRARDSAKATGRDPKADRQVQLIVINMERWRWVPRQLGNYHVWNNVPEFNVRVMKSGEPIYQEKTIVGQFKYATPFFSSTMRNIVFHPNWTVPPTIIREDLAPKLQGPGGGGFFGSSKEAILQRYGLSANYKGKKINADTVDWNNVNIHAYTFTQDPGPANVLGQFKFNFPNKHAIYMHDTPQRELFAERTRTLSHGCIRVNQPDRLAALLLSEDKGWSMGQVRSLVARGPSSSTVIALKRPVPVHLTYFTAIVGENGQVTDFGDIYGIDNRMASQLFKNPASFPVPATPAVAEEGSSSRTQAQTQRRRGGGFDSFISGLFGN